MKNLGSCHEKAIMAMSCRTDDVSEGDEETAMNVLLYFVL